MHNVAEQLKDDVKSIKVIPWSPTFEELEEEEELSLLMVQLLSALQGNTLGRSVSKHTLTHLSHHTVCHKATHYYRHKCHCHPSWDDSQQGAC